MLLGVAVWLTGCDDPCVEIASRLRACCARGPAELRNACEAEARELEEDGNTEACESSLEKDELKECAR